MANRTYELHHHFPKLAEESGFTFNMHRPRAHVDWHKIRSIDIESIIKERKFHLIEQHLNDIFHCVLESEFDVRILDEGVLKMFRLAQLAVEYQQFCRHYLDRSVYVLREEITGLTQELETTKKNLHDKEEELRRLKRKTKHSYRTPLPYGNDNIATMILKTLSNKSEIFGNPSTSNADSLPHNKCTYCEKVFLNQLYLKSHINRRHSNIFDIPQKDICENIRNTTTENENPKLNDEIVELKNKLQEMESLLLKVNNERNTPVPSEDIPVPNPHNDKIVDKIIMKDAEVSTNTEANLLDKIEEWKKEEHEKYNKEINLLRTQIEEIVNSVKYKEDKPVPSDNTSSLIEQLHATIKQQGKEIHILKHELINARLKSENEEVDRKKEVDAQMTLWAKRVEAQSKQYEALEQKLNEVAQEAGKARAQAETERLRAKELQALLEQNLKNQTNLKSSMDQPNQQKSNPYATTNGSVKKKLVKRKLKKTKPEADVKTLESLHRKAQELLNIKTMSSTDVSSSSLETARTQEQAPPKDMRNKTMPNGTSGKEVQQIYKRDNGDKNKSEKSNNKYDVPKENEEVFRTKELKIKKDKPKSYSNISQKIGNGVIIAPGSPMKLVRSKITEEVNNRLVTIGVDPLKNSLPKSHFKKQKVQLQQQHELKAKKNPKYQKLKHSILAYLDASTSEKKKEIAEVQEYVSPNRIPRTFSLTSVISNVKNKALAFVKSNDTGIKAKRREVSAEVAKKAMALLKTPPSSVPSSPIKQRKVEETSTEEIRPIARKHVLSSQKTIDRENIMTAKRKININYTENDSSESDLEDHKFYNSAIGSQSSAIGTKSIENLIKSPARRPSSASAVDYNGTIRKLVAENVDNSLLRSQSAANILEHKVETNVQAVHPNHGNSSDELASLDEAPFKAESEDNIPKQTKGVLKNASSISSLNKKKVLFDMDAIQMKSVSASPSQSITEKSENNENFELGLVNLDGEEWDISSIENESLKEDTKIQINTRTSPKIAELKQTIESQLARRNETPSTALAGGVDLIPAPIIRNSSIAGSNTSLGSSILDESDGIHTVNRKAFVKSKNNTEKDDSEIDISEYSLDGILNKKVKNNDSF